jgi:hypothetical protein
MFVEAGVRSRRKRRNTVWLVSAPTHSSAVVLAALIFLSTGCGSKEKPAAVKQSTVPEPFETVSTAVNTQDEYYSEECQYHVVFPPGTQVRTEESPAGVADGASFEVHAGGETLHGEVYGVAYGTPTYVDIPTAQQYDRNVGDLGLYRDRKAAPSPAPPFVVTYRVVKPDWYVFSGTRGDEVVYEKGLHYANSAWLRVYYPAAKKEIFNPVVAGIANSFSQYAMVTAKAGVMVGEEDQEGLLFLDGVDGDNDNLHTTCAVDAKDRGQFSGLQEGQTVTVGGQPHLMNVKAKTELMSAVFHRRLDHCVVRSGRR